MISEDVFGGTPGYFSPKMCESYAIKKELES
jgi:hypothetical protein